MLDDSPFADVAFATDAKREFTNAMINMNFVMSARRNFPGEIIRNVVTRIVETERQGVGVKPGRLFHNSCCRNAALLDSDTEFVTSHQVIFVI